MNKCNLAVLGALLLVGTSASAAPSEQLECAYDKLNGPTMLELARVQQSGSEKGASVVNAQTEALLKPLIRPCADRFGWNAIDIENAKRHYMVMSLEFLISAVLEKDGVDVDVLNTLYKTEPISRAEMWDRFQKDGENYRAEWIVKIKALNIGVNTPRLEQGAVFYIELRLVEENLAEDFEAGLLRD